MILLLLLLLLIPVPAYAGETTVGTDQDSSAVIIDGTRAGGSVHRRGEPCREYVMSPREEGVLPGDAIIAIPCRGTGVRKLSKALREHIVRYLPPLNPGMQPGKGALVHVPEIFWSGQSPFTLQVTVLDVDVVVVLTPTFEWSFGDGRMLTTAKPGARYPSRDVTHIYDSPCRCTVTVKTTWSGRWSDGGAWRTLPSVLTQEKSMVLDVRRAPIRLVE